MSYRDHYNATATLRLYQDVEALLCREKMFRLPTLSAAQVAQILGCNPRTLSAAIAHGPYKNFRNLLAAKRIEEACRLLHHPEFSDLTIEEIALNCGFLSRQAFYMSFRNIMGITPRQYRLEHHAL